LTDANALIGFLHLSYLLIVMKKKYPRPRSTGKNHWNYKHGKYTTEERQRRADFNCRLCFLCDMAIHGGFMSNPYKFLGRPPKDYFKPDLNNLWHRVCVHIKINGLGR